MPENARGGKSRLPQLLMRECAGKRRAILPWFRIVADTPVHKVKTQASLRTIPIPRRVWDALARHANQMKVRHIDGYLFLARGARPWKDNGYSHRLKGLMRECHKQDGPEALVHFPPRKLRATFCTLAYRLGAEDRLIRKYMGHSSQDVMGDHYLRIELADLRRIADLFDGDWVELSGKRSTGIAQKLHGLSL